MNEWTDVTIQKTCTLRARIGWQGLRSDEFKTEGAFLVTGTDFVDGRINWDCCYHVDIERYKQDTGIQLKEDDLLITKDGTIGKIALVKDCPVKATLNSGVFVIRPLNNSILTKFLFYILSSYCFDLFKRNILTGSTIKHLNQAVFYQFKFRMPVEIREQAKIAEILTTIDTVIEKTKILIAKHQAVKEGLLQDLLTNGIDKDGNIRSPETHKYKPSPLGIIPEEWEDGTLADIAMINPTSNKSQLKIDSWVSFIPMQDVSEDGRWTTRREKQFRFCESGYTTFTENDILFAKITPCMENGKGCIVKGINNIGFGSTEFHVLRAKKTGYHEFIYYWTVSRKLRDQAITFMTGSAGQQRVKANFFKSFPIGIPSKTEQIKIAQRLMAVDNKIITEQAYLAKLEKQKQGLMQDLLNNVVSVVPLL